jgi:hypothetical protein
MVGGARITAVVLVGGLLVVLGPTLTTAPAGSAAPADAVNGAAPVRPAFALDFASSSTATTNVARTKARASKPKTVQIGHSTFWECSEKSTKVLVAVSSLTLHLGTPLAVNFTVRNTGSTPCNYVAPYAGVAPGPTATVLGAGPCGSLGFEVVGPGRHNVWPGPAAFDCPALGFAQLQPGASISGAGTWAENKPGSIAHVAPGRYTLVLDRHFRFPVRIEG